MGRFWSGRENDAEAGNVRGASAGKTFVNTDGRAII